MDLALLSKVAGVLLFVIGLILLVTWLIRRFGGGGALGHVWHKDRDHRIEVIDATPVDAKRRLVLVRRDSVEHLVLIGGPNDMMVETGIAPPPAVVAARAEAHKEAKRRQAAPEEAPAPASAPAPTPVERPAPMADLKPARPAAPAREPAPKPEEPRTERAPSRPAPLPTPASLRTAPAPEEPVAPATDTRAGMSDMAKRLEAALRPLDNATSRPPKAPADDGAKSGS